MLSTYVSISIAHTPRSIIAGQRPHVFKCWVCNCISTSAIPWVLGHLWTENPLPWGTPISARAARPGCQLMRLLVKRHKHSFWSWAQRPHLHGTSRQTLGAADTETSVQLMNKQAILCWDPDSMCFHSVTLYTYKLSVNKQTLTSVSLHSYADRKDTHFEVSEQMVRFYQSTDSYMVNSNSCFFSHLKK